MSRASVADGSLRMALDVDPLEPNLGGIGRYTWELCKRLPSHPDIADVLFYGRGRLLRDPGCLQRGSALPRRPRLWRQWQRRRAVGRLGSTLFHGPNYFLPHFVEGGVITVHDLSVFRFPETHPAERVAAFEREFHSSLARAAHVITDTQTIRAEVIAAFGLAPKRVSAVHLGVNPAFRPMDSGALEPVLATRGLRPGGYGLCVSTLEPRKKIAELLRAWRDLPRALRDRFPLVLAGGSGWRNAELRRDVEAGVAEGWLHHLGFVKEALLPQLYAGAALFLYPSIYEGFGLPPLEAMASGVPVLVAGASCLPEVCGPAAACVDPDDLDAFRATIAEWLSDEALRERSASAGLLRAAEFTWDKCIDGTVAAYRKAAVAI